MFSRTGNSPRLTSSVCQPPASESGWPIYLSEAWALDLNVKVGQGHFSDVEVGNIPAGASSDHVHEFLDIDAESERLTVGVSWWP